MRKLLAPAALLLAAATTSAPVLADQDSAERDSWRASVFALSPEEHGDQSALAFLLKHRLLCWDRDDRDRDGCFLRHHHKVISPH
jgi:hypothetical protein